MMDAEYALVRQQGLVDRYNRRNSKEAAEKAISLVHPDDAVSLAVSIIRNEASRDHIQVYATELRMMATYLEKVAGLSGEAKAE